LRSKKVPPQAQPRRHKTRSYFAEAEVEPTKRLETASWLKTEGQFGHHALFQETVRPPEEERKGDVENKKIVIPLLPYFLFELNSQSQLNLKGTSKSGV
jgi:hypothetical protein